MKIDYPTHTLQYYTQYNISSSFQIQPRIQYFWVLTDAPVSDGSDFPRKLSEPTRYWANPLGGAPGELLVELCQANFVQITLMCYHT